MLPTLADLDNEEAAAKKEKLVLRKRGVYLAMLTLAMSQVFYYAALMWTPVTGGTDGLGNLPVLYLSEPLGWRLSKRPLTRYYVVAGIIVVAMLVVRHILASPLGRVMRAVKANETRAAACGYNTRRVKLGTSLRHRGVSDAVSGAKVASSSSPVLRL